MKKLNKIWQSIQVIITWLTPLNFNKLISDLKKIWSKYNV